MSRTKKRGGRGGWRGKGRGGASGGQGEGRDRWNYPRAEIVKRNESFEQYYNQLGVLEDDEKEQFWESMRSGLPNSFRFTGSRGHALTVQRRLVEHYIPEIVGVEYDGQLVAPPTPVQWYPDQLAWSMTTPKNVIRKFPPFASFQKFLVSENSVGNITRQEIVSMIPPLMLDIKPGMTVLDLCAAPGSKSAQMIELVHSGEETRIKKICERLAKEQGGDQSPEGPKVDAERDPTAAEDDDWTDDGRPTGLLIANDVDYKRAQMLIHQCKRLNSPNLIVANHDATLFPSIKMPSDSGNTYLKFDRILADVPCTGDGTTRKNPEVWKEWAQSKALGLHVTQVRILVRALQMLKVGGRVVYSTCSLNPIEDEAVLAAAIDRCGGSAKVQLVDKADTLPGLKRRPGITNWKVMDKTGRWWTSWEQVNQAREEQGEEGLSRVAEGMFPPPADSGIELHHATRIYPHLQDTGGFFIAVLEKKSEIKARPENAQKAAEPQIIPSITSVADEIKNRDHTNGVNLEKIDALDDLAPPNPEPASAEDTGNQQPVARQNKDRDEDIEGTTKISSKRVLDDEVADADSATKRLKTRNEEQSDPTPQDQGDRQVRYPPPPGATTLEVMESDQTSQQPAPASTPAVTSTQAPPKRSNGSSAEESFKYLDPANPELETIREFYDLSPRFPRDRFMVRNPAGEPVKSIYYTSRLARAILTANEGTGLKFVHCGVKMFVKQDTQNAPGACRWRIQTEGLPIVAPWVGEARVVRMRDMRTLRKLLVEMFPRVAHGGWREFPDIGERVRDLGLGCCVLRAEPGGDGDASGEEEDGAAAGFAERLVMPLWRGAASLNLMLPKDERKAMLLRLFNDDTPLVDHSKERRLAARGEGGAARIDVEDEAAESVDAGESDLGVGEEEDDEAEAAARIAEAQDNIEAAENAALGEEQDAQDKTREVAPGVTDEDDSFNNTV